MALPYPQPGSNMLDASAVRPAGQAVHSQVFALLRGLGASPARKRLVWLSVAIVVAVCANAAAQIRLNNWRGAFFDALEQRHFDAFTYQLWVFLIVVSILLVLGVAETWLREVITVRLREWLTQDLL
ncbi:MAG: ABC transporter ATP-binding protein/permease, partial [Gammaproteobacteria bacterium]